MGRKDSGNNPRDFGIGTGNKIKVVPVIWVGDWEYKLTEKVTMGENFQEKIS